MNFREIYLSSLSSEVFLDAKNLSEAFNLHTSSHQSSEFLASEVIKKLDTIQKKSDEYAKKIDIELCGLEKKQRKRIIDKILIQTAPFASTLGMTLHGLSAPSVFQDRVNLEILKLHADDVGVGKIGCARFDRYLELLRQEKLIYQANNTNAIGLNREIRDCFFEIPAMIYAFSLCKFFNT